MKGGSSRLSRRDLMQIAWSAAAASALSACSSKGDAPPPRRSSEPLRVGSAPVEPDRTTWWVAACLSSTGSDAAIARDAQAGLELALANANAGGAVAGRALKGAFADDASSAANTGPRALELVARENVVALLGHAPLERASALATVARDRSMPLVLAAATDLTAPSDFVYRVCFTDDFAAGAAARFAVKSLGKTKLGLVYDPANATSGASAAAFKKEALALGASFPLERTVHSGDAADLTSAAGAMKGFAPDLVYAPLGRADVVTLAESARSAGVPPELLLAPDPASTTATADLTRANGIYQISHFAVDAPWTACKEFSAAYQAANGRAPTAIAALCHDAALLIARALLKLDASAVSPATVRAELDKLTGVEGATGVLDVGNDRVAAHAIVVTQLASSGPRYVASVS
ncbi:MAG: ABC transporter substrate-binding protein [Polyangiaceae bacterium]